jgi:ACR3 family arsenite transporter
MEAIIHFAVPLEEVMIYVFTLSTMLSCGLSLTWHEIVRPLNSAPIVIVALVTSFIFAPLLAWILTLLFNLDTSSAAGLLLLGVMAGAPVIPKFTQIAQGDVGLAAGLMVLLTIITIGFSPLVLPVLIPSVEISPWDIARPQIIWMLLPLIIGLSIMARFPKIAKEIAPMMTQASTFSMLVVVVLIVLVNYNKLWSALGSGAFAAMAIFIVILFVVGFYLGGKNKIQRVTMGIATAERNVAAALLVASVSFNDAKVIIMVVIGALMLFIFGLLGAAEIGRRANRSNPQRND